MVDQWQDFSVKLFDRYIHEVFLSIPFYHSDVSYAVNRTAL